MVHTDQIYILNFCTASHSISCLDMGEKPFILKIIFSVAQVLGKMGG